MYKQKLSIKQEFITVHVLYKRVKDSNSFNISTFWYFYSKMIFISIFMLIIELFVISFNRSIDPQEFSMLIVLIFFSMTIMLVYFGIQILIEEFNSVFFFDFKFSFIIDPSSLVHEIIHGHIFEKIQCMEKWEVWAIDDLFKCLGYFPEYVKFPNFTLRFIIGDLFHLIHDLIGSLINCNPLYLFGYIRDFFTVQKIAIKELKRQIKRRKT